MLINVKQAFMKRYVSGFEKTGFYDFFFVSFSKAFP